jgi:hypothetical protein
MSAKDELKAIVSKKNKRPFKMPDGKEIDLNDFDDTKSWSKNK